MAKNEMTVRRNYGDGKEECRSSESRYNGLEFYYTEKHIWTHEAPLSEGVLERAVYQPAPDRKTLSPFVGN